jgi:hypothetical protein
MKFHVTRRLLFIYLFLVEVLLFLVCNICRGYQATEVFLSIIKKACSILDQTGQLPKPTNSIKEMHGTLMEEVDLGQIQRLA